MQSRNQAPHLYIKIPEIPAGAKFTHHPIAKTPRFYRKEELRDKFAPETPWLSFFEEILCGLCWKLDGPVPYGFHTFDGRFRKLDTGCLKFLLNRTPKGVDCIPDTNGYIDTVIPTEGTLAKYAEHKQQLVAQLDPTA